MMMRGEHDQIYHYASLKAFRSPNEYLLHHLAMFFTIDLSKFGLYRLQPLPSNILIGNRFLGIGANSIAFHCSLIDDSLNEFVLKICNKYEIIEVHEYALFFHHLPGKTISKENLSDQI